MPPSECESDQLENGHDNLSGCARKSDEWEYEWQSGPTEEDEEGEEDRVATPGTDAL